MPPLVYFATLRKTFQHWPAAVGGVIVIAFLFVGVVAPYVVPFDPSGMDLSVALERPSGLHPLGTDELGRDMLSRVLVGARISLQLGVGATAVAAILGTLVGL